MSGNWETGNGRREPRFASVRRFSRAFGRRAPLLVSRFPIPVSRFLLVLLLATPQPALAQTRGTPALAELVDGLGVSMRVLVIGAHPDDEDTRLIAWLARGRKVETAYLSLTRGDGGQNLIGNELGEALGVIRTEELLAARRIDGAHQYFTRAYDFGFSRSAEETYAHWPREEILGDVIKVVRAFEPHVIVSVFSGTARDGHGQHQVAGMLAREAYDLAGDAARFSEQEFGAAWTPLKFYRSASFRPKEATLSYNAGEFNSLLGRSYAEIAAESRSQHKSQAFGVLQRKGAQMGHVLREASRANESTDAKAERSLFDGIDTTWTRLRPAMRCTASRAAFDSIAIAKSEARRRLDVFEPGKSATALAAIARLTRRAINPDASGVAQGQCRTTNADAIASLATLRDRADEAVQIALGVAVEATAEKASGVVGESTAIRVVVYNRGNLPVRVSGDALASRDGSSNGNGAVLLRPDSSFEYTTTLTPERTSQPWWLTQARRGDLFALPIPAQAADVDPDALQAVIRVGFDGGETTLTTPVVFRFADPVRGEVQRPVAIVPAISVTLDRTVEYVPANAPIERTIRVQLRSAAQSSQDVRVSLSLPNGVSADSAHRTVTLPTFGAVRSAEFRLRGRLASGTHTISATAESAGEKYATGYIPIEYEHIRPQTMYRDAIVRVEATDVKLPAKLNVAYIPGAGDNVAPALRQLGIPLTVVEPASLATMDLSRFTTVVVGPRAYESSDALVSSNARLLEFAHGGGTLVVQYGQYEMMRPGMMPFAITINRPHDRVTDETAPMTVLAPTHPLFNVPNQITDADWRGWIQERSLYMPRTFAEQYVPLLSVNDPGQEPRNGALLVTSYGKGTYVYTTLAFFRQLPAGVPGAARLFANLLGAGRK
ncbi:MAG: PIG-L family deacetylase [Gemmatimonadaceae bacterium]|nr:PIG-L family deacetylase [Gemmatimonadaceae bacterium]